jgi:hypothetical protein
MRFRFEFPQGESGRFSPIHPAGTFIENEDPLVAAYITPSHNIATNRHFGWTDDFGSQVHVYDLEVGGEAIRQLHRVELAIKLVKVSEWEELEFNNQRIGTNDYLKCGPFDLSGTGERTHFLVCAGASSQFEAEHKKYYERVPLNFLTHSYAIHYISVVDSRGRRLVSPAISSTGGGSCGSFIIRSGSGFWLKSVSDGEEIEYPIRIKIKLPKRYEQEQVTFHLDNVPVPEPN